MIKGIEEEKKSKLLLEQLKAKIEENDRAWNEEIENGNNDKLLETLTIKAKVLKECLKDYEQSVDYKAKELNDKARKICKKYSLLMDKNVSYENFKDYDISKEEFDILNEWLKGAKEND